jgi:Alpha galactosidase A/Alpha galactosidase A C-terminal beta sandwich domain
MARECAALRVDSRTGFVLLACLGCALSGAALGDSKPESLTANGLAPTPPMGWNSWNRFGCNITETTIRRQADALVSSGMRDAGYTYVVVDDCWHGERDAAGNIHADPERFPSGIQDRLGVEGHRAAKDGDVEIWVRPLEGGARAVALLNRGHVPARAQLEWSMLKSGFLSHDPRRRAS